MKLTHTLPPFVFLCGQYYQNGNAGACGNWNSDDSMIVAVNSAQFKMSDCGRKVWVWHRDTGKVSIATIADECPTCSYGSLDFSVGLFKSLGKMSTGELPIKWNFY